MTRRDFMRTGAVMGVTARSAAGEPAASSGGTGSPGRTSLVMSRYSADEHRRRLENLQRCEQAIRSCMRKHIITDYQPGQWG